jgi:phage terminase large subunit-like protein
VSAAAVKASREQRVTYTLSARDQQAIDELRYFSFYAWPTVEPGRRLKWNWHLSLICQELQEYTRPLWDPHAPDPTHTELVVCVPPRSLKSYLIAVCLPAWLWLRSPWIMYQGISNDESLASRDSLRTMQLIQSAWYQGLVRHLHVQGGGHPSDPLPWGIDKQQAQKVNYANTQGGGRVALGINSAVTGKGADLQALDDPYDAKQATRGSPIQIARRMAQVVTDYDEVLRSRLNDPSRSLRLVIMQRLDPNDLAGTLIKRGARCVVLPMEYDPDFPAEHGGVHPRDPRTVKGQLLMPGRWSAGVWAGIKGVVEASRHVSAQYNQLPRLAEGGLFKKAWFTRRFQEAPWQLRLDEVAIFVDCSFKGNDTSSFVVLQVWGRRGKAWFAMLDQVREQMSFVTALQALVRLRAKWPTCRRVVLEAKANGPATVDALRSEIPGIYEWEPGTKSKYERAEVGSAPALQAGQVYYPQELYAPWLQGYTDRHVAFDGTSSVPDDEIDTTSMALLYWTGGGEHPLDKLKKQLPASLGGAAPQRRGRSGVPGGRRR